MPVFVRPSQEKTDWMLLIPWRLRDDEIFENHNQKTGLGFTISCAKHYVTSRGLPSADTLTSGRLDWNVTENDRAFLQIQDDRSSGPLGLDPISSLFDLVTEQPWWQGQLVETHAFGPSAASQFLLGGIYISPIFKLEHGSQATSAFPATLNFLPGTFTPLGGANSGFASPYGVSVTRYQISEDIAKTWRNQKLGFGGALLEHMGRNW